MPEPEQDIQLYIGWDVGGWNCDKNPRSRDALVVLDAHRNLLGIPWRGNLRKAINDSGSSQDFVQSILNLCEVGLSISNSIRVVFAIDTPLSFSGELLALIDGEPTSDAIEESETNAYLFRYTERYLFERGLKPLSAIKDMIGSQATKGMHVLAKFAPKLKETGVWTDSRFIEVIEAYPSGCKHSAIMESLCAPFIDKNNSEHKPITGFMDLAFKQLAHDDERDALICALMAWLYHHKPDSLVWPDSEAPHEEGWIFVPSDFMPTDTVFLTIAKSS